VSGFLLAISGPTAAGKTYFTRELITAIEEIGLRTVTISTDEFYYDLSHLSMEERIKVNYDQPKSINEEEFKKTLETLRAGQAVELTKYDFSTHTRTDQKHILEPADLIIVEGIFSLTFDEVNPMYDLKVYIELEEDLRLIRRVRRDMRDRGRDLESVFQQYISQVKPAQHKHVKQDREKSDVILLGNKDHTQFIKLLTNSML